MYVKPTVGSESLWDDEKSLRERLNTHLDSPLGALLHRPREVRCTRDFEGSCTRDECFVFNCVLDGAETIAKSILCSLDGVWVGALDEESNALGVFHFFHECVFFFAEGVLVDESCPAEDIRCEIVNRVLGYATAYEL